MKAEINAGFQSQNTNQKRKSGPYLCVDYAHRPVTEESLIEK